MKSIAKTRPDLSRYRIAVAAAAAPAPVLAVAAERPVPKGVAVFPK